MGEDTAMITGGSVQIIDINSSKWLLAIMFLYFSRIRILQSAAQAKSGVAAVSRVASNFYSIIPFQRWNTL